MREKIRAYAPMDVYGLAVVYFVALFLNSAEFISTRFQLSSVFSIRDSIIYGLIRGLGDDHISRDEAFILYWVVLLTSVILVYLKANSISAWLWRR